MKARERHVDTFSLGTYDARCVWCYDGRIMVKVKLFIKSNDVKFIFYQRMQFHR